MARFTWLTMVCILMSNFHQTRPIKTNFTEERAEPEKFSIKTATEMRAFLREENLKKGIPDFAGKVGLGIGNIAKLDFSKPTSETLWNVADIAVPLVAAGLALLPGVGPIIGGTVALIYGVLSPLIRRDNENPMKGIIQDIYRKLDTLNRRLAHLEAKIINKMREERNQQFKSIMNRAFQSEISRNEYICNKYARVSKVYVQDLKNNRTIDESLRIEMMSLIHDCDNFLKDTTEAFVYPEFADVLWVPSIIMTLMRITFLTEVSNYGVSLKIDEDTIFMFWEELKADIKRHLKFTVDAIRRRIKTIGFGQDLLNYELEGCKIQKLFLYFDREIYPFGLPQYTVISEYESEVNIADFNVTTGNDEIKHVQILYNEYKKQETEDSIAFLNCIMGPNIITRASQTEMVFRITYVPQKSYQLRVLYFISEGYTHKYTLNENVQQYGPRKRSISAHKENKGDPFQVLRMTDKDPSRSPQRFDFKTAIYRLRCDRGRHSNNKLRSFGYEKCGMSGGAEIGRFVVETVFAFNVLSDEDANSTIVLENIRYLPNTIFFGVELIVRPVQPFLPTW